MNDRFEPAPPFYGAHLQTVFGQVLRSRLTWPIETVDELVEVEPGVRLLLRCSWQNENGSARKRPAPALLLLHGLEGCDQSVYMIATGLLAYRCGWHVLRMNFRGCGDSLRLCPWLYNAGQAEDLVAVARWLAERSGPFAVAGFSLGANVSLLAAGRDGDRLPGALRAIAAVCPPLDMSACADAMERPINFLYERRFVNSLLRSYRDRQKLAPERYEHGRERGLRTLREFDDVITAHYHGYRDAEDYYRKVSSGGRLHTIAIPTLVLASSDDPFIPHESVRKWEPSSAVHVEITKGGGHVGFIASSDAPGRFWAAERLLHFLEQHVERIRP